jgi:transposase-like protein
MNNVTVSARRNRVYERKFNHEEAVRRHDAGASYSTLAREYGVTPMTVRRVVLGLYDKVGRGEAN